MLSKWLFAFSIGLAATAFFAAALAEWPNRKLSAILTIIAGAYLLIAGTALLILVPTP